MRCIQGGAVLLLVAVCLNVGYNTASKSLSVDIGGAKRLHALSTAMSACLLLPWMMFTIFTRHVIISRIIISHVCVSAAALDDVHSLYTSRNYNSINTTSVST